MGTGLFRALTFTALFFTSPSFAADWPAWRGANNDGQAAPGDKAPLEWSKDKNVKWKVALPRPGNSSPIVVGGKVFVATALDPQGLQRSLICFDRKDGKQLWQKTVAYETTEPTHGTNPYCAATPAADKECVVAWQASAGLFAYDHDGKELWKCDLGVVRHIWGWANSPIIHGDVVFLNVGPGDRQFMTAIDKKTGKVLWQTEDTGGGEKKYHGAWSTPRVVKVGNTEQLLCTMPQKVNAYDLKTGKILWTVKYAGQAQGNNAGPLAYSDVYVSPPQPDGSLMCVAMAGFGGPAMGFKIDANSQGDITEKNRVWTAAVRQPQEKTPPEKNPQRIGTGVILGDRVIVPCEPYIGCYELQTGKEAWRHGGDSFWGSIVQVGDRLYVTSQKGTTYVFAADAASFKQLAKNDLGDRTNCTPAISDGQIFIRTNNALWCIE
jgi:outer membrane protein assembly factor BamB